MSPIIRRDQSKKYFGIDMLAMNILPVHILAENKANGANLILDREKISLEGNGSYDHNKKVDQSGTGEVLATVGSVALMTGLSWQHQRECSTHATEFQCSWRVHEVSVQYVQLANAKTVSHYIRVPYEEWYSCGEMIFVRIEKAAGGDLRPFLHLVLPIRIKIARNHLI